MKLSAERKTFLFHTVFLALAVFILVNHFFELNYRTSIKPQYENQILISVMEYKKILEAPLFENHDLTILNILEEMDKKLSPSYVFILNTNGVVVAHKEATEIGKSYSSPVTQRSLDAFDTLFQYHGAMGNGVLDLSIPFFAPGGQKKAVLRVGFKTIPLLDAQNKNNQQKITFALLSFLLFFGGYFLITTVFLFEPLKELKNTLTQLTIGKTAQDQVRLKKYPELENTLKNIAGKLSAAEAVNPLYQAAASASQLQSFLPQLSGMIPSFGILFIDKQNVIAYVNTRAESLLHITQSLNKHIFDALPPDIMKFLEQVLSAPNKITAATVQALQFSGIFLPGLGIVVLLEQRK
ncbi:MAG TPA: hypothetical protein VJC03_03450 [bacterium]|nr:hypothetical protein [bacterium]